MAKINPNRESSAGALALGSIGASVGLYELAAIVSNKVPTISEVMWSLPVLGRVAILGVALIAGIDHFITRKVL